MSEADLNLSQQELKAKYLSLIPEEYRTRVPAFTVNKKNGNVYVSYLLRYIYEPEKKRNRPIRGQLGTIRDGQFYLNKMLIANQSASDLESEIEKLKLLIAQKEAELEKMKKQYEDV